MAAIMPKACFQHDEAAIQGSKHSGRRAWPWMAGSKPGHDEVE
jgi:hypothetical protein